VDPDDISRGTPSVRHADIRSSVQGRVADVTLDAAIRREFRRDGDETQRRLGLIQRLVNECLGISRRRARLLLVRDRAIQESVHSLHPLQLVGIGDIWFVACSASLGPSLVQQTGCIMNGRKMRRHSVKWSRRGVRQLEQLA
jgi:hypothetical protein